MPQPQKWAPSDFQPRMLAEYEASGTDLDFDAWVRSRLAEQQRQREAEDRAEWEAERQRVRLATLVKQTPARYAHATTDDPALLAWATDLLASDRGPDDGGPSIAIAGPTGTGKTHAMFGALRHYVESGGARLLWVVTAADMYARMRPRAGQDSEAIFESFAKAPLLAIDDIGAAKATEWTDEVNYRLLNHRYNAKLPTVITTNVPPRDFSTILGERVASRMAEMMTTVVLKGNDRRRKSA